MNRKNETTKLQPGQAVTYSGFKAAVVRLYIDGETESGRMYEIRTQGGVACVCGSDLILA